MSAQYAWANIRPTSRRIDPTAFSPFLYRYRNSVERFINKQHYRAVATRYERRATNYLALVKLAAIRIWLRHNESVTQLGTDSACRKANCARILKRDASKVTINGAEGSGLSVTHMRLNLAATADTPS
jgi:hypothetical protein